MLNVSSNSDYVEGRSEFLAVYDLKLSWKAGRQILYYCRRGTDVQSLI